MRDAHFAERDGAGRHVEHDRFVAVARHDAAERIRRHASFAPAPRRDLRFVTDDVDEMHRHQTRASAELAIRADATEVMRVAQADGNDAGTLHALDARCRLLRDRPPGRSRTRRRRARTAPVSRTTSACALASRCPDADVAHVSGNHADAVRVVAFQIRLDEMCRDLVARRSASHRRGVKIVGDEIAAVGAGLHQHLVLLGWRSSASVAVSGSL